jgi:hypothetical protein
MPLYIHIFIKQNLEELSSLITNYKLVITIMSEVLHYVKYFILKIKYLV